MNKMDSSCWDCIHHKVCKWRRDIDKNDGFYQFEISNCKQFIHNSCINKLVDKGSKLSK